MRLETWNNSIYREIYGQNSEYRSYKLKYKIKVNMYNKPNLLLMKGNELRIENKTWKVKSLYNKAINVCTKYMSS